MAKIRFQKAVVTTAPETLMARAVAAGHTPNEIAQAIASLAGSETFLSECGTYQVMRRPAPNDFGAEMICLSIKRVDREPLQDWRILQEIKNAIVGEECEAIELYPAESRLVDTTNQRWLWCFADTRVRVPIGFTERMVCNEAVLMEGTKQRPRDDG